jgi:hypothetical protein
VKGTRPGHMPQPSRQSDRAGRTCGQPGCETRLSVYNLGNRCWQHTDLTFPNYRGKRLAEGGSA